MRQDRWTYETAFSYVMSRRALANPNARFADELRHRWETLCIRDSIDDHKTQREISDDSI